MLRFGGIIAEAALPFPIDKPRRGWYTEFVCGYGGIGRRARLRIWYLRCAGSTPVTRTTSPQAVHRLRRLILSHRRARSAAAPSPHKILLAQTFVGAPAARRAAYRLCSIQKARPAGRAFLISLRHSISAQEPPLTRRLASKRACGRSPSPRGILPMQTSAGNLSVRSALASPAMEYRDYQRNHERNCHLHCFSSYRSFVFILSSSSFSCFSD